MQSDGSQTTVHAQLAILYQPLMEHLVWTTYKLDMKHIIYYELS